MHFSFAEQATASNERPEAQATLGSRPATAKSNLASHDAEKKDDAGNDAEKKDDAGNDAEKKDDAGKAADAGNDANKVDDAGDAKHEAEHNLESADRKESKASEENAAWKDIGVQDLAAMLDYSIYKVISIDIRRNSSSFKPIMFTYHYCYLYTRMWLWAHWFDCQLK